MVMWASIPWNWVIPLIVLVVLLIFSIALACFCRFTRRKDSSRQEDPKVMLHNIDSVEVISNPTCATVFVPPADAAVKAGNLLDDDEIDLGLGTKRAPSKAKPKKSKTDRVAAKDGAKSAGSPDAFTNPEADISLVAMDLRSSVCRDYHNAVDIEHTDVNNETSESAPMIPSKKK